MCSESTGKENLETTLSLLLLLLLSEDEDTENAHVCSLPVNPCTEVPMDPSALAIFSTKLQKKFIGKEEKCNVIVEMVLGSEDESSIYSVTALTL